MKENPKSARDTKGARDTNVTIQLKKIPKSAQDTKVTILMQEKSKGVRDTIVTP